MARKKCPENHFDSTSEMIRLYQSENRKTIEKPLKELPWDQQSLHLRKMKQFVDKFRITKYVTKDNDQPWFIEF